MMLPLAGIASDCDAQSITSPSEIPAAIRIPRIIGSSFGPEKISQKHSPVSVPA
jgi:hypothetical protein